MNSNQKSKKLGRKVHDYSKTCQISSQLMAARDGPCTVYTGGLSPVVAAVPPSAQGYCMILSYSVVVTV